MVTFIDDRFAFALERETETTTANHMTRAYFGLNQLRHSDAFERLLTVEIEVETPAGTIDVLFEQRVAGILDETGKQGKAFEITEFTINHENSIIIGGASTNDSDLLLA